jgi:hypothetical protein
MILIRGGRCHKLARQSISELRNLAYLNKEKEVVLLPWFQNIPLFIIYSRL